MVAELTFPRITFTFWLLSSTSTVSSSSFASQNRWFVFLDSSMQFARCVLTQIAISAALEATAWLDHLKQTRPWRQKSKLRRSLFGGPPTAWKHGICRRCNAATCFSRLKHFFLETVMEWQRWGLFAVLAHDLSIFLYSLIMFGQDSSAIVQTAWPVHLGSAGCLCVSEFGQRSLDSSWKCWNVGQHATASISFCFRFNTWTLWAKAAFATFPRKRRLKGDSELVFAQRISDDFRYRKKPTRASSDRCSHYSNVDHTANGARICSRQGMNNNPAVSGLIAKLLKFVPFCFGDFGGTSYVIYWLTKLIFYCAVLRELPLALNSREEVAATSQSWTECPLGQMENLNFKSWHAKINRLNVNSSKLWSLQLAHKPLQAKPTCSPASKYDIKP